MITYHQSWLSIRWSAVRIPRGANQSIAYGLFLESLRSVCPVFGSNKSAANCPRVDSRDGRQPCADLRSDSFTSADGSERIARSRLRILPLALRGSGIRAIVKR